MDKSQEGNAPPNFGEHPPPYPGNYSGAPQPEEYPVPPLTSPPQGNSSKIDFILLYYGISHRGIVYKSYFW